MKTSINILFVFTAILLFSACGDDSSSNNNETPVVKEYNTKDDLPHCTKSYYGKVFYVASEEAYFECNSQGWSELDSAATDSLLDSLATDKKSSSSKNEDKPKSSSSFKVDSTDTKPVETKKVDSATIKGFAQKGPFADGSTISVVGFDSKKLENTKEKFTDKVVGDSGYYQVKGIVLAEQFATIEVQGFYAHEVTGKQTKGTKTKLSALADLSESKSVNVNILSHLEKERALNLVKNQKFNIPAAKKRATAEVLNLFGAVNGESLVATQISLADTGAAGAALIATSVALQGELSASKFAGRLDDVADEFAQNGTIANAELRAEIADELAAMDSLDSYKSIRENIKAKKLSSKVAPFEPLLRNFWESEYGLEKCTSEKEESVQKVTNKLSSKYGAGFACTHERWHQVNKVDSELGLCTEKRQGELQKIGKDKFYMCQNGKWETISEIIYNFENCSEKNEGKMAQDGKKYVACINKTLTEISAVDFELNLCTDKREKEVAKTEKDEYYGCVNKEWVSISAVDYELKLCTSERVNEVAETKKGDYYGCIDSEWKEISEQEFDLELCSAKHEKEVITDGKKYYGCVDQTFKEISKAEFDMGLCADKDKWQFTQNDDGYFACVDGKIKTLNQVEYDLKLCLDKNIDSPVTTDDEKYYGCVDNIIREISKVDYDLELCIDKSEGKTAQYGSFYFICQNNVINEITAIEYELGFCDESKANKFYELSDNTKMICDKLSEKSKYEWRSPRQVESEVNKICNNNFNVGDTAIYCSKNKCSSPKDYSYYQCQKSGSNAQWFTMSQYDIDLYGKPECNDSRVGAIVNSIVNDGNKYVCENNRYRNMTDIELSLNKPCTEISSQDTASYCKNSSCSEQDYLSYICKKNNRNQYYWNKMSALEYDTFGKTCTNGAIVNPKRGTKKYVCDNNVFRTFTDLETSLDDPCYKGISKKTSNCSSSSCIDNLSTKYYLCKTYSTGWEWEISEDIDDYETFDSTCTAAKNSKTFKGTLSGYTYVCDNLRYRRLNYPEKNEKLGLCLVGENKSKDFGINGGLWTCNNSKWKFNPKSGTQHLRTNTIESIGFQRWFVLNEDSLVDGSVINNNHPEYGRYYTWYQATGCPDNGQVCTGNNGKIKGVCPEGSHIPTKEDIEELLNFIKYDYYINQINYSLMIGSNEWGVSNADNYYGFSAYPSGYYSENEFQKIDLEANFWTSTKINSSGAYYFIIFNNAYISSDYYLNNSHKRRNVRCIKD